MRRPKKNLGPRLNTSEKVGAVEYKDSLTGKVFSCGIADVWRELMVQEKLDDKSNNPTATYTMRARWQCTM